jgi:hypothetical protein
MARAGVAIATSLSMLAISTACSGLPHASAAALTPPAPRTPELSPWSVVPAAVASAERAAASQRPTGVDPQPSARQGSTAPPPAESRFGSGDGINLDPLGTCVSCTSAGAGNNSSASESRELRIASESLAEGQGPANGYNGGSALSLPPNSLLDLALGSFQMDNRADHASSEAHSHATFADLRLADGRVARIAILESRSNASYSPDGGGHRDGSSSGVNAGLSGGRMAIVLLHSDSSSSGPGHVYLVQLNDREVASADQLGTGTPLIIHRVATVSVFRAGPDGAVVGGVQDGSSNQAAGVLATSADAGADQH